MDLADLDAQANQEAMKFLQVSAVFLSEVYVRTAGVGRNTAFYVE